MSWQAELRSDFMVGSGLLYNQANISQVQGGQEYFFSPSSRCPWLGPARLHLEVKVFTTGSSLTEPPALTSTIKTMASSEKSGRSVYWFGDNGVAKALTLSCPACMPALVSLLFFFIIFIYLIFWRARNGNKLDLRGSNRFIKGQRRWERASLAVLCRDTGPAERTEEASPAAAGRLYFTLSVKEQLW